MASGSIKISYVELSSRIGEMQSMRNTWESYSSKNKPDMVGGGSTVAICDQVADMYVDLYTAVCNLMDQTITFLNNLNQSVEKTDQNAADAIEE